MSGPTAFTLAHPYAPSVFATYLSAESLISAVETLFNQEQQLSVRFLHFWFNSFSAMRATLDGIDASAQGKDTTHKWDCVRDTRRCRHRRMNDERSCNSEVRRHTRNR